MSERPTVVLVHGAWHGAWCWDEVVDRLGGDGLAVVAVDLPSVVSGGDLYDDARAVRAVLDDRPGDKVVVGHSYGGIVITPHGPRRRRRPDPPRRAKSVQNAEETAAPADHRVVTSVCNGSMPLFPALAARAC